MSAAGESTNGTGLTTPPAIAFREFELGFPTATGTKLIVEDVTLDIPAGELLLVLGPSGSGKSSLVAAALGFDDPYHPRTRQRGRLEVLGTPVAGPLPAPLRRKIGVLFQDGALIDELSPGANVALAVRESGGKSGRHEELLRQVGLPDPPRAVAVLSGGQRRRVALARALATEPDLLVLDEPTAGLDPASATEIARVIREVHDATPGRSTLVVTHDLDAFRPVADGALILDPTRGGIELHRGSGFDTTLERIERSTSRPAGPQPVLPIGVAGMGQRSLSRFLLGIAEATMLIPKAIAHLVPYHLGMLGRALVDQVLRPAAYIAIAAVTMGALATCFALRNNPLEGALQREILMGNGKVLVGVALPLAVCILFAARNAAGAAARIGSLRRAQVFEALPLLGVSPVGFLLTPLLLSSVVGTVVLSALGIVSGCLAGLLVAGAITGMSPFAWASATFALIDGADFQGVLLKAIASGIATALTAYHLAARPKLSAKDVENATNGAIVWSTTWVLLLHGAMTLRQYWDQ